MQSNSSVDMASEQTDITPAESTPSKFSRGQHKSKTGGGGVARSHLTGNLTGAVAAGGGEAGRGRGRGGAGARGPEAGVVLGGNTNNSNSNGNVREYRRGVSNGSGRGGGGGGGGLRSGQSSRDYDHPGPVSPRGGGGGHRRSGTSPRWGGLAGAGASAGAGEIRKDRTPGRLSRRDTGETLLSVDSSSRQRMKPRAPSGVIPDDWDEGASGGDGYGYVGGREALREGLEEGEGDVLDDGFSCGRSSSCSLASSSSVAYGAGASVVDSVAVAIDEGVGRHSAGDVFSAASFVDDDDDDSEGLYNGNTSYATSVSSVGRRGRGDSTDSIESMESELPPTMAGLQKKLKGRGTTMDHRAPEKLPSYREAAASPSFRR